MDNIGLVVCYIIFGPDFEVPVLRVKLAKRTLINKIMRFFYKYFVGFVD